MDAAPSLPEMPEPTIPAAPADDLLDDTQPQPSRPQTRGDCKDGLRPCPWMSCHYHLLTIATAKTGSGPGSSTPLISTIALLRSRAPGKVRAALYPLTEAEASTAADEAIAHMDALGASCILDIADEGVQTLEQVAKRLGVVRERVRQIEVKALRLLREEGEDLGEDGDA